LKDLTEAVCKCRTGDTGAYREVVRSLQARAIGYAYHYLGNYLDAEDAAQEGVLQAWRRLKTLRDDEAFLAWFFQILANTSKRKLKQKKNNESLDDFQNCLLDSKGEPGGLYEKKERQQLIRECIQNLPHHYRSTLILRDLEGFTYADIAKILQIPEGTVKSRISSARERLRSMLHNKEGKFLNCSDKVH